MATQADRRDVVRDAVALVVASFDDPDLGTRLAADLVNPRAGEDLVAFASRIGSTMAVCASAAASFARHWATAIGDEERAVIERYAATVSADLNARDLADGTDNTQPEGN